MAPRVLVTGASGYVGGRLVPALLDVGARVRVGGRSRESLASRDWSDEVEIAEVDLLDRSAVRDALQDVDVVVFLVHAMGGGRGYADREARMATIMAEEAASAGTGRIVYLSGLHPDLPADELSEHMASRERVAEILAAGPVPTLILKAATIIGGGSASFEIIRHLTDVLPVMPAPRWVHNRIEPLAIADILHYLVAGVMAPEPIDGAFAVGSGESGLRFADLMTQYAKVAGLARRLVFALPMPLPLLSGLWITLVTPVPRSIAMPLAQSMQHEAISHGRTIDEVLEPPEEGPTPYREAVRAALAPYRDGELADLDDPSRAPALGPAAVHPGADPDWAGPRRRTIVCEPTGGDRAAAMGELRRLVRDGSSLLDRLAGRRGSWALEADPVDGGPAAHRDAGREGRLWLAFAGDRGTGLRLVSAPEGIRGRLLWWLHRSRRTAALRALADAVAGRDAA